MPASLDFVLDEAIARDLWLVFRLGNFTVPAEA